MTSKYISGGRIAGFGAISIDNIIYVNESLSSGKGKIIRKHECHGGNVATGLVAAAKLGANCSFIGLLSDDIENDKSIQDLQLNNIDISCATHGCNSGAIQSTILVDPKGSRFIAYDDTVMENRLNVSESTLKGLDVLLVDSYAINSLDIIEKATKFGIPIVLDVEFYKGENSDKLINFCDHLILPIGFAASYTGHHHPIEIINALWSHTRTVVILTDGEQGVYYRDAKSSSILHYPAYKVSVVDTTGAGDCFHGAFACALASDKSIQECIKYSTAAAALSTMGKGGREALPSRSELESFMDIQEALQFNKIGKDG